jgi:leucine dehydrogenase
MQACAKVQYGSDSLANKTVSVQGCGHVGYHLCKLLYEEGAKLIVSDIDDEKVKRVVSEMGAHAVGHQEIYGVDADIFAPCALGAIVNDDTLVELKVDIIAGAANNQLAEDRHGDILDERGIVYAPDYVINSGGVINVNAEIEGWTHEQSHQKAEQIYDTILHVLQIAKDENIPSYLAADHLAARRIEEARRKKTPAGA